MTLATGRQRPIRNPKDGSLLAHVPEADPGDVDRPVGAATAALPDWRARSAQERAAVLLEMATIVDAHAEELAQIESANVGKPIEAARIELPDCSDVLRFFAGAVRAQQGPLAGEYRSGFTSMLRREPVGVCGLIAPWNYPLLLALWKAAPALAAGNTCVLKPSELTPLTALRLAELVSTVVPYGVLRVVCGEGATVGAALVAHPGVAMVSLTGDTATGIEVARTAAASLTRVALELGGKAPVLVFDDADLATVAAGVRKGGFWNSGQDCSAATRVISVGDEARARDVTEALAAQARAVAVGDPAEKTTEMGPLVSPRQRERVDGFLARAQASGATLVRGSAPDGEAFAEPVIATGVAQDSEIVQREVFGPVVTVQRAANEAEALALANGVPYGLVAGVWTVDGARALRAAAALDFGTVWVNDHFIFASELPHGGFGASGYGKDCSLLSLDDYTRVKNVTISLGTVPV